MSIFTDVSKTMNLMLRVHNNKMEFDEKKGIDDEKAIKTLCNAVFGDGGVTPDPTTLHQFNNIVVKVADKIAEPDLKQLLDYFANWTTVPANTQLFEYRKPHPVGLRFKWTATGSNVALKRVEAGEVDYVKIENIQTGISYNPLTNSETCVENFRALVNDIAAAKIRLVYEKIMQLIQAGIGVGGAIPQAQIVDKANATAADFNKVANIIARRTGARPIFVADRVLINYFADLVQTDAATILVDNVKDDMYNYELTNLRTADAIPLENRFTSETGVTTEFPVNRGYILGSSGTSRKPFEVALAGGLVQHTENEFIHGRVKMAIRQGLGIDMLVGNAIGYIEEDSITGVQ